MIFPWSLSAVLLCSRTPASEVNQGQETPTSTVLTLTFTLHDLLLSCGPGTILRAPSKRYKLMGHLPMESEHPSCVDQNISFAFHLPIALSRLEPAHGLVLTETNGLTLSIVGCASSDRSRSSMHSHTRPRSHIPGGFSRLHIDRSVIVGDQH